MQQRISLQQADGGLALDTPYDGTFLAEFKAKIPYSDRTWDAARKRWIIAHEKAPEICRLVEQYFGVTLEIPQAGPAAASELRVLRVEYVGRCKARKDGDPVSHWTASGYCNNVWSLVFPEPVLRAWFQDDLDDATPAPTEKPRQPAGPQTLYRVLTVKQTATPDELKRAYRQLARQWHPDTCREADAHEQFIRIKHAYDVLSDAKSRRKYDAGLKLEASLVKPASDPFRPFGRPKNMAVQRHDDQTLGYRSPLRCGMLVVEGTARVGQFVVSKILRWDDVVRDDGKTMVSSWPAYGDTFEINWV
jgi:hypothetical protein